LPRELNLWRSAHRNVSVLKKRRLNLKLKIAESDADEPKELLGAKFDSFS
jgi:hypothetical protein